MAVSKSAAQTATLVFQRLGLGAKPGGLARIADDPKAALLAEINTANIALIADPKLPTYAQACVEGAKGAPGPEIYRVMEERARFTKHLQPEIGFVERLVIFWSNHFAMSYRKAQTVRATIGQFERDIIRKHVLGSFPQMLREVMTHPAMIRYLDNEESIGEESEVGLKKRVSYTENLAREMLELHTVGTGSFSESDVKALAKMLTGWSVQRNADPVPADLGQFAFRAEWHQPGPQVFFGQNIPEGGTEQALAAMDILSAHPNTARKIAIKLLRHFVMDEPTEEMVFPVAQAYLDSGGDLKAVATALLDVPAVWSAPMTRIRTPYEMFVAQFRALGSLLPEIEQRSQDRMLMVLNQPPWDPPSPEGFADDALHWLSPQALAYRIDAVQKVARMFNQLTVVNPASLATNLYGGAMSKQTRERVAAGGSQSAGLTILFASPEFQRR